MLFVHSGNINVLFACHAVSFYTVLSTMLATGHKIPRLSSLVDPGQTDPLPSWGLFVRRWTVGTSCP